MGMPHSGSLCDWVFYKLAEQQLLNEMNELGIVFYVRYRDDIFAALRSIKHFGLFFRRLSELLQGVWQIGLALSRSGESLQQYLVRSCTIGG